jgi:class 3 adenylate cyclase/CHASE2 domain-containing sensor protein
VTLVSLKSLPVLIAIPLLAAVVAVGGTHELSFLTKAERAVGDLLVAYLLPTEPQDPDVVVVGIMEETLAQFPYREPVDRGFLANLLKTLESRKPRAVALDTLFDQPTEDVKDNLLRETIAHYSLPLAISYTDAPYEVNDTQLDYLNNFVPFKNRVWANQPEDPIDGLHRVLFAGKTNRAGVYMPGLARGVAAMLGIRTPDVSQEIVWHGRPDGDSTPFRIIQAQFLGFTPPEWVAGKIVMVGGIVSLRDRYLTPLAAGHTDDAGNLPGVVIHAHAISQLIHERTSRRLPPGPEWVFVLLVGAIGTMFGRLNVGMAKQLALTGGAAALLAGAVVVLFRDHGIIIPLIEPGIAFFLATWGTDAVTGREAKRQREFINGAFARYLNPQLVKQLADDPARLQLGGEMREMTLMFCDIRGFTTISEKFDAQGLTRFINRFLTPMTDLILSVGGTIDKYMGDCIMAFWNAPLDDADHAEHGCRAALAMRTRLSELNAAWRAEAEAAGQTPIAVNIGIGVNTGVVCVGNVGSDQRFDYSVLGDDVNLASRLEGQSKTYHLDIVIGENTAAKVVDAVAILELDSIKVKGKTQPVRVFALVGDETVLGDPAFLALREENQAMLEAYRRQDWAAARQHAQACKVEAPVLLQGFYDVYDERIADYEAAPPPGDWDGVYVALTK